MRPSFRRKLLPPLVTADTPKVDPKDWSKTMESLVEYLATFRGVTGVPLSYVVRKELIPKTAASDPPTNYNTLDEEMIARAPIMATANASEDGPFVDTFIIDRVKVWEKLSVLMISAEAWTYLRSDARARTEGRHSLPSMDTISGQTMWIIWLDLRSASSITWLTGASGRVGTSRSM